MNLPLLRREGVRKGIRQLCGYPLFLGCPLRDTEDSHPVSEPLRLAGALGGSHSPDASAAAEGRGLGSTLGDP